MEEGAWSRGRQRQKEQEVNRKSINAAFTSFPSSWRRRRRASPFSPGSAECRRTWSRTISWPLPAGRAGYNINQRRKQKSTIGPNHRVTQEEAMKWFVTKYDGILLNPVKKEKRAVYVSKKKGKK